MIEDDAQLASILARQLGRFEFVPHMVDCYGDIVEEIRQLQPHAILLVSVDPAYNSAPIIFVPGRSHICHSCTWTKLIALSKAA